MWNSNTARSRLVGIAIAGVILLAGACALIAAAAMASESPASAAPAYVDLLLVEHTYDGPVERAGVLVRYQFTGAAMLVEWADTTTDGVFRSGFEQAP